jgi:hypothetical protein
MFAYIKASFCFYTYSLTHKRSKFRSMLIYVTRNKKHFQNLFIHGH